MSQEENVQNHQKKKKSLRQYVILYSAFFVYSLVAICSKLASGQTAPVKIMLFLGLEVVFLGVYALIWQQSLKSFSLVTAMSSKGIVMILNLLWSVLLFHESINLFHILGAGAIMFGIWMVAEDG